MPSTSHRCRQVLRCAHAAPIMRIGEHDLHGVDVAAPAGIWAKQVTATLLASGVSMPSGQQPAAHFGHAFEPAQGSSR